MAISPASLRLVAWPTKIVDERLKAFDSALTEAGQVVIANDWKTFGATLDQFGVIKHGEVLAVIGEGAAYDAMKDFYDAGVDIWNDCPHTSPIPKEKLEAAYEKPSDTFSAVIKSASMAQTKI